MSIGNMIFIHSYQEYRKYILLRLYLHYLTVCSGNLCLPLWCVLINEAVECGIGTGHVHIGLNIFASTCNWWFANGWFAALVPAWLALAGLVLLLAHEVHTTAAAGSLYGSWMAATKALAFILAWYRSTSMTARARWSTANVRFEWAGAVDCRVLSCLLSHSQALQSFTDGLLIVCICSTGTIPFKHEYSRKTTAIIQVNAQQSIFNPQLQLFFAVRSMA